MSTTDFHLAMFRNLDLSKHNLNTVRTTLRFSTNCDIFTSLSLAILSHKLLLLDLAGIGIEVNE